MQCTLSLRPEMIAKVLPDYARATEGLETSWQADRAEGCRSGQPWSGTSWVSTW
jgi:hypothetical protein